MGKTTTISVKMPIELKEKIKKYNIKPSIIMRKALEEAIFEIEISEKVNKIKPILAKLPPELITKSIRDDRNER
ncbi:MAG: CopG family transcriptional regulator [Candidatus Aenigmatarchaeota archaeon]